MEKIECTTCGSHHLQEVRTGLFKCNNCKSYNYVSDDATTTILKTARNALYQYNFDEATKIYEGIRLENKENKGPAYVQALIGLIYADFGIVFVNSNNKKFGVEYGFSGTPIISNFKLNEESILDAQYYKDIMNANISDADKEAIKTRFEELDSEYARIKSELETTPDYDVFICAKVSKALSPDSSEEEQNAPSLDLETARELYNDLKGRNLKVFFSEQSLLSGIQYDAQIQSRLLKSKVFLLVASTNEYLNSPWVQSEWRRWLNMIDRKKKRETSFFVYQRIAGLSTSALRNPECFKLETKEAMLDAIKYLVDDINKELGITREAYTAFKQEEFKSGEILKYTGNDKSIKINPDQYNKIGRFAFHNAQIERIEFGTTIKEIGDNAFRNCKNLKSVIFSEEGKEFKVLQSGAFYNCKSLISINLPNTITTIEPYTFYGCEDLREIFLPNVIKIEKYAFAWCPKLRTVWVNSKCVIDEEDTVFDESPNASIKFLDK